MNTSSSCRRMGRLPFAVAAAAALALAGCGGNASEQAGVPPEPEVRTAQAKPAGEDAELRLPARALPGETARLYPRATGFVSERRVDIGDKVEAGQVLAVIATPEADQDVRAAQADLVEARARFELARGNHDRAATLVESRLISREDYSDRVAARDAAKAALAAAEAHLAGARERQAFQVVRAPFAGIVAARHVERGDRVVGDSASATSPMFELNALDPLRIAADVPQSAALQVQPGLRAEVGFRELPGERFEAEVVRSARSISGDAGGMRVELRLPNPGERIPAGMVGEVTLKVRRAASAVVVPVSAVLQGADGARVARVGKDSVLDYAAVTLGRNLGGEIEVVSGLAAGDVVVLAPNALLAPGARVRAKSGDAPRF